MIRMGGKEVRKLLGMLAVCAAAMLPGLMLAVPTLAAPSTSRTGIPLINSDEDIVCFGGPDGCVSTKFIQFTVGNQPYITVDAAHSTSDFAETNCTGGNPNWCYLQDLSHNNAYMNAVGSGPYQDLVVPSGFQSNFTPEQWKRVADGRGWDYINRHFGWKMGQCFATPACTGAGVFGDIAVADGIISNGNIWTLPGS